MNSNLQRTQEEWNIIFEKIGPNRSLSNYITMELQRILKSETICDESTIIDTSKVTKTYKVPKDLAKKLKCAAQKKQTPVGTYIARLVLDPLLSNINSK